MTLDQIITELCESGGTYECNRSLFAFINRCLNGRGCRAKIMGLGDMVVFGIERIGESFMEPNGRCSGRYNSPPSNLSQ